MTYDVRVTFSDHTGKRHTIPTVLDLSMYVGTGGVTRHGVHDIHKQLKDIAGNVKRWTDFSGLKVLTRADLKERQAERDARTGEWDQPGSAAEGDEKSESTI
jgi:hypothetical protein